ncbi:MAG: hypothetical protein HYV09_37475 [Deltaproteobacteria bacterium]|nr:hypothetical protein [Deltaproteobacteria bacterium]
MKRLAVGVLVAMVWGCGGADTTSGGALDDDTGGTGTDDGSSSDDTSDPFNLDAGGDDAGGDDATVGDSGTGDGLVFDTPEDTTCATSEVVAAKPPVDVIVVVDQSGSMYDDNVRVKNGINKLSDYLKATGLDYHVIMIARVGTCSTTSCTNVCVPPPLGGPTTDCDATSKPLRNSLPPIYRTSNSTVSSTNALSMLLSTYSSTTTGIKWSDAVRPEAFKAIVPITDDNSALTAASFDTQLLAKAPVGMFGTASARKYAAFPIMGASTYPSETKCGSTMVNNGSQYIQLVKLTGGKWFPLCATDFGPLFTDMAKSIASAVACEVAVPSPPPGEVFDPAKVNVVYMPSSGGSVPVVKDESKPCASGANGWQMSSDGKKILLCGTACTGLKADPGGKVTVQFGCAGKPPPPPPDGGTCTPFGAKCGDADICCPPLSCLPGPDGSNICRAKGPA